jgi:Dna[CI] antecedent DciA-like protein
MKRIEAEIRREIGRFGPAGTIGKLVEAWPAAVGESIARNAWPARVGRDGTLHVATSSSAWAFELAQLAPTILPRLREHTKDAGPEALRFAPGPLPEGPATASAEATFERPEPTAEIRAQAEGIAAAVGDERLRELIARAAAASLAAAAAGRSV